MKTCLVALFALSFTSIACGFSPILNHGNAGDATAAPASPGDRGDRHDRAAADCQIELAQSGLCASITWDTAPSTQGDSQATLRFWDAASATAAGPYRDVDGEVAVKLFMPSMGHGSQKVNVAAQGGGVYALSNVIFSMPGDWEVRVQIKQDGKIVDQGVLAVSLSGGNDD
jgi:hypothetical protein